MKITTLNDIIEEDVDETLYLKKSDWEKRKFLKISLPLIGTVKGDDVYILRKDIRPPQILKQKRTAEEKRQRHLCGDKNRKFGRGLYLEPTGEGYSNTLTTFSTDNYVWDRNGKVRELTNREAFRLMDVDDEDIDKIFEAVPQKGQKKLAGNSIVVNVMTEIFRNLLIEQKKNPERGLF